MSDYKSKAIKYLSEQTKQGGFNYTSILYSSEVIILTGSDAEAFAEKFHHPKWNRKVERTTFTTDCNGGYIEIVGYDFSFLYAIFQKENEE